MERKYHVRYSVEIWDKEAEGSALKVHDYISVTDSDYGYADDIFIASIIRNGNGEIDSILLLDSVDGHNPSKEMLMLIKEQIEHHLSNHL